MACRQNLWDVVGYGLVDLKVWFFIGDIGEWRTLKRVEGDAGHESEVDTMSWRMICRPILSVCWIVSRYLSRACDYCAPTYPPMLSAHDISPIAQPITNLSLFIWNNAKF